MEVLQEVGDVLKVLGHPHRLKIVELLEMHQLTVGELAENMNIAPNACSQHLNLMRAHGILSAQRDGKTVHYKVKHPSAHTVIQCIRMNMKKR